MTVHENENISKLRIILFVQTDALVLRREIDVFLILPKYSYGNSAALDLQLFDYKLREIFAAMNFC